MSNTPNLVKEPKNPKIDEFYSQTPEFKEQLRKWDEKALPDYPYVAVDKKTGKVSSLLKKKEEALSSEYYYTNPHYGKNAKGDTKLTHYLKYNNAEKNALYSKEESQALIDKAEKLGIDYHHLPNYQVLDKRLAKHDPMHIVKKVSAVNSPKSKFEGALTGTDYALPKANTGDVTKDFDAKHLSTNKYLVFDPKTGKNVMLTNNNNIPSHLDFELNQYYIGK
jgi:hypothetical protein